MEAPKTLVTAVSRLFGGRLEAYLKEKLEQDSGKAGKPVFRGCITVSRQSGCRALPVCELLAGYLQKAAGEAGSANWQVHDKDIVEHIIGGRHLPPNVAQHLKSGNPGGLEEHLAAMIGASPGDWTPVQKTIDTVRSLAGLGEAIIIGRGGNFITADMKNCFHVRLIGSEWERREVVVETRNIGDEGSSAYLRRVDQERLDYVRSHFDEDASDPLGYHVVLNTDDSSDYQLARMLAEAYLAWRDDKLAVQGAPPSTRGDSD